MREDIKSCHCVYSEYAPEKAGTVEIVYYQSMRELINVEMLKVYFGEADKSIFSAMGNDVLAMVKDEVRRLQEWGGKGTVQMLWLLSQQSLTELNALVFLKAGAYLGRRRRRLDCTLEEFEGGSAKDCGIAEFELCAIKEVHKFVDSGESADSICSTNSPVAYLFNCRHYADGREKELLCTESFGRALAMFKDTSFYTYTDMQEVIQTIASVLGEDAEVVSNCLEFFICRNFLKMRGGGSRCDSLHQFITSVGRAAS